MHRKLDDYTLGALSTLERDTKCNIDKIGIYNIQLERHSCTL